jgi:DnaD/phage-associated family protein
VKSVFKAWEKAAAKLVSPMQGEELLALLDEYGKDALLTAIKAAAEHNAVHLAYVKAVLAGKGEKPKKAGKKHDAEVYDKYSFDNW